LNIHKLQDQPLIALLFVPLWLKDQTAFNQLYY